MAEDEPDARRLAELEERLRKARGRGGETPQANPSSPSLGVAFRMSFDLVAAVVAGAGMGWLLDRWLGTTPFLFIVCFFLGVGAGFLNVFRAARRLDDKGPDRSNRS
jgi:ATP synthase protein I